MRPVVATPTGCPVVARGFAAGGLGGVPIGGAILFVLLVPGQQSVLTPTALMAVGLLGGGVGAVIGAMVGLLSGIVLAIRETGSRTDRNRRVVAAVTSAAPVLVVTGLCHPVSAAGWLAGLAIAAVSAAAAAALASYVVQGRHRCR